jgi:hypothetical protein
MRNLRLLEQRQKILDQKKEQREQDINNFKGEPTKTNQKYQKNLISDSE